MARGQGNNNHLLDRRRDSDQSRVACRVWRLLQRRFQRSLTSAANTIQPYRDMTSTLLQRHPPSFLSRTVCGWQRLSPTTGGRGALLLAISVGVLLQQLSMATAQEFQCPDGQVVLEFAGEIPDVFFEDYTAFNVSVTSSAASDLDDDDEDIFELVQSWPNAASMEPLCVPANKCLTVQIHINEPYRTTNLPQPSPPLGHFHLTTLRPRYRLITTCKLGRVVRSPATKINFFWRLKERRGGAVCMTGK
jgi:hypothetical protein